MDLAAPFREAGIVVAIGGFHVSGCLAMLPQLPSDLHRRCDVGVTLFAGEAEGRLEGLFADALAGRMRPIYNYMDDLPGLQQQVTPFLPIDIVRRYGETIGAFDAGRGCPFQCSFCTIINVQGRKSRWRDADDVERLVRANLAQGVFRFFITDDNFARNRNWEAIFDRLIEMREKEGLGLQFIIQVDTLCHRIPNFVDKAARAGCKRVFIGLENINPDNLLQAKKKQNRVHEYREMFLAWRAKQVITYAGYILGFPNDTPERIARDIKTVQQDLPVDLLEFFILTPLPGSADHKALDADGVWMDPDMNKYDLEHVTTGHPVDDRGGMAKSLSRGLGSLLFGPTTSRPSSAAPRRAASNRCGCSTISCSSTSPLFRKTCIRCRAAISAARFGAAAAPACRAKTRSSSTRAGSAKSSKPMPSSPRFTSICTASAAASNATIAPTPTRH